MASMITGVGKNIVASANVAAYSAANLIGIFVSSASLTPTITVYDDNATGTTNKIVDTFTPVAGTFYPLYLSAQKGFYIVIGGTVSCTAVVG